MALTSTPVLAHFDLSLDTCLHTDASRKEGLGYMLLQRHADQWRMVECGTRFLSEAETRYAMVEIELAGVTWAVKKCRLYLQGLPHFRIVDHKPLVPILNQQTLAHIENPKILRQKEKLAGYIFTAEWRKGKDHVIPDALSRAPVDQPTEDDLDQEAEVISAMVQAVDAAVEEIFENADPILDRMKELADRDPGYQSLVYEIMAGFPTGWER